MIPFFRITALLIGVPGVELPTPVLVRPLPFWSGLPYGGGRRDRAAFQSKGIEEDIDGVEAGDR